MPDALSLPLIVGLSALGAWFVARVERCVTARAVTVGVLAFAATVLGAQVIATLAAATKKPLLGPWSLTLAVAALAALAWAVTRARGKRGTRGRAKRATQGRPTAAAPEPPAAPRHSESRLPLMVAAALGLASLGSGIALGLSNPPREWDVLMYHLPRAVAWLQHGNLGHYGYSAAFYPGNGEVPLLVALFQGTDRLTTLVQTPFALLGAVALYGLARELGASRRSAPLAGLAFLLTPMVVFQTSTAMNDLTTAGVVIAGAYLLVRAFSPSSTPGARRFDLAVGGIAFGLALGTKYTAMIFVLASLPVVAVALRLGRDRRTALRETALFAAALALPSVFWFAQNGIATGNPFAPILVKIGGWTVFHGTDVAAAYGSQQRVYAATPLAWCAFPWTDRWMMHGTYSGSVGFGAVFAAFVVPAVVVLGRGTLRVRNAFRGAGRDLRAPLLLILLALGIATWWTGGFHLPRYVWPFLALLYAPAALLFDEVGGRWRGVMLGLFAAAALFSSMETVRLIHADDDFLWSRVRPGTTKRECYHMPDLIYGLPPGTRILLHRPTDSYYYRFFRYPLVGGIPGNEVVMAGDIGVDIVDAFGDTAALHEGIRRERVQYVFSRTLTSPPMRLCFDDCPNRYRQVFAKVEPQYPWHRRGIPVREGARTVRDFPVVTRIYRVLGT